MGSIYTGNTNNKRSMKKPRRRTKAKTNALVI
jgi:hypothetical protein